jgi:hypothetical protein
VRFLSLLLLVCRFRMKNSCLVGAREVSPIPEELLLGQERILFYDVF